MKDITLIYIVDIPTVCILTRNFDCTFMSEQNHEHNKQVLGALPSDKPFLVQRHMTPWPPVLTSDPTHAMPPYQTENKKQNTSLLFQIQ